MELTLACASLPCLHLWRTVRAALACPARTGEHRRHAGARRQAQVAASPGYRRVLAQARLAGE